MSEREFGLQSWRHATSAYEWHCRVGFCDSPLVHPVVGTASLLSVAQIGLGLSNSEYVDRETIVYLVDSNVSSLTAGKRHRRHIFTVNSQNNAEVDACDNKSNINYHKCRQSPHFVKSRIHSHYSVCVCLVFWQHSFLYCILLYK